MEKRKEESDMKVWKKPLACDGRGIGVGESLKPHRPEPVGRPAGLPLVKLADLLAEEPDTAEQNEAGNSTLPKPHRPEPVGRPAGLPLVKLADLLAEEPDTADSGEIDTGPAVGKEVW